MDVVYPCNLCGGGMVLFERTIGFGCSILLSM